VFRKPEDVDGVLESHIHTHCGWSPGFAVCVAAKAFLEQVVRIKVRRIHESCMRLRALGSVSFEV